MKKRASLNYEQVKKPLHELVSKLGGQPNWIQEPEWPLDKAKGEKMVFIGQIVLQENLFGDVKGKVAYLFIDGDEEGQDTWDPESGQNAVVIQPGNNDFPKVTDATGPVCEVSEEFEGEDLNPDGLAEFKLIMNVEDEPDYMDEDSLMELAESDDEKYDQYCEVMSIDKVGGSPLFIQGYEFPIEGDSKLICQLDESSIPILVNFGCGVAYVFMNSDGTFGKLLWQC